MKKIPQRCFGHNPGARLAGSELLQREFSWLRQQEPHLFHLTINEAEAIAWQTGYPALVFPVLAAEKIRALAAWQKRQRNLHRRTEWAFAV